MDLQGLSGEISGNDGICQSTSSSVGEIGTERALRSSPLTPRAHLRYAEGITAISLGSGQVSPANLAATPGFLLFCFPPLGAGATEAAELARMKAEGGSALVSFSIREGKFSSTKSPCALPVILAQRKTQSPTERDAQRLIQSAAGR
jgi:hypothetical protein